MPTHLSAVSGGHDRRPREDTYQSLWELRRAAADPVGFLSRQAARSDIARFTLRNQPVYLLSHPAHIEQVLIAQGDKFRKSPAILRARRLLGQGLLTAEPPVHPVRRRLIQPVFHRQRLEHYADVMVAHAVRVRDRWTDGQVIDLAREMTSLALAIVGDTLFGEDLAPYEARLGRVLSAAIAAIDPLVALVAPRARTLPARQSLLGIVEEIVERRQRDGREGDDMLGLLIAASDSSDREQLHDDVLTMLLAGHDTIANAMTWMWTCLADHPHVDARLGDEIERALGGRLPTVQDLPRLGYLRAVLSETLRLRPPAWLLARSAIEAVSLGDVTVPAGAMVLMSPYLVHRDPRFFADPLVFRPERWLDADARPQKLAFFPFGAGRRSCIGEPFAWMEGVLVLAVLAGRWRIETTGEPSAVELRITMRPRGAVGAIPRERYRRNMTDHTSHSSSSAATVRRLLARRAASAGVSGDPADDLPLGAEGLGLDSVAIVELLLECETETGVRLPPDLAEEGGLTVGRLIELVSAAAAASGPQSPS